MKFTEDKKTLVGILKQFSGFKIICDKKSYEEAGWKESEEEYQKTQTDWINNQKKKK